MEYALITGGSKGIGKEMALILAQKGYGLLLIARSEAELLQAKTEALAAGSSDVRIKVQDLSQPQAASEVFEWYKSQAITVTILINNAGYGMWGFFDQLSLAEQFQMMQVNMQALVAITHAMLPELKKNKQSYILNIASTAAYQAVPAMAVYSASKAFVLTFSRAIRFELKQSNVCVTAYSPGATATNFTNRAGMHAMQAVADKFNMPSALVAKIGIAAMFARKAEAIPGMVNILTAWSTYVLPKWLIETIAADLYIKPLLKK